MRRNRSNASVLERLENIQIKKQKAEFNNRYNFLHDTVVTNLNKNIKLYTDGKFEEYINDWRTSNDVPTARRSRFKNKTKFRNFKTDRFENIRKFMFKIMDHIRQSIILLEECENISLLRDEYEKILSNPYLLMRYYQYRFKKVLQKKDLNEDAQLNVVPILKPYIIEYIKTYDFDAKAIRSITNINAITSFDNVVSYIEDENNKDSIVSGELKFITFPTTIPTTGPTTGPTTIPTTGPTTIPTTGPTTIPTTGPTT